MRTLPRLRAKQTDELLASAMSVVGANVKMYRKKLGLTQEHLAFHSNVNYSVINEIEKKGSKNPELRTLVKLSKTLKVEVEDLFKKNDNQQNLN